MKALKQLHLPSSLLQNKTATALKSHLSLLGPNSAYFSCLLYKTNNKYYFLLKDQNFPYISFDWTMYTLMRSAARTVVTSGRTLRREPGIYGEGRGDFGREELREIYERNVRDPFNLLVYTRSMSQEEIRKIISQKYFKLMSMSELGTANESFKEIVEKINALEKGPAILENGDSTLGKSMAEVKPEERNFVQMIVLSLIQGSMPQKYIGVEYNTEILERDFDKVWQSEVINSTASHDDGQQKPITLKFIILIRKDKPQKKK